MPLADWDFTPAEPAIATVLGNPALFAPFAIRRQAADEQGFINGAIRVGGYVTDDPVKLTGFTPLLTLGGLGVVAPPPQSVYTFPVSGTLPGQYFALTVEVITFGTTRVFQLKISPSHRLYSHLSSLAIVNTDLATDQFHGFEFRWEASSEFSAPWRPAVRLQGFYSPNEDFSDRELKCFACWDYSIEKTSLEDINTQYFWNIAGVLLSDGLININEPETEFVSFQGTGGPAVGVFDYTQFALTQMAVYGGIPELGEIIPAQDIRSIMNYRSW